MIFLVCVSQLKQEEKGMLGLQMVVEAGTRISYRDDARDLYIPEINGCFVPLGHRSLKKLQKGDFIWSEVDPVRSRGHLWYEYTQICSMDRYPDGRLGITLCHDGFVVDPCRPTGRIVRLSAPTRLLKIIAEHPACSRVM